MKPSALEREHPALQNMKFLNFFLILWAIFNLLDPDSESGSTDLIESGYNQDPDPNTDTRSSSYSGSYLVVTQQFKIARKKNINRPGRPEHLHYESMTFV